MTRKEFDLARVPGGIAGSGVLPRGPPRAGLGFDRGMAGPFHGHRARPPGPPQDRARPGFASLDHHRSWRRLPVHAARRRLRTASGEERFGGRGCRPIAILHYGHPILWSKSPMEPVAGSADTEDTARYQAVVARQLRTSVRAHDESVLPGLREGRERRWTWSVAPRALARRGDTGGAHPATPRPVRSRRKAVPHDLSPGRLRSGRPLWGGLPRSRIRTRRPSSPRWATCVTDKTILVAEDDNNTRRALQHYLKRIGLRSHRGGQRGRVSRGGLRAPVRSGHPRLRHRRRARRTC